MLLNKWIFLIFAFVSCVSPKPENEEKVFSVFLEEKLLETREVSFPLLDPFSLSKISDPVGTWLLLFEVSSSYCLFYKTPLGETMGRLRLNRTSDQGCSEAYDDGVILELSNIKDLHFKLPSRRERSLDKWKEWKIEGKWKSNSFEWEFVMPLLKTVSFKNESKDVKFSKIEFKKLSSSSLRTFTSNVLSQTQLKGKYQDRYSDGEVDFCHRFNSDCEVVQEFDCETCRYGWQEVVDYQCNGGYSKICGPNRCGQRGEPACPRGVEHLEVKSEYCEENSKAGFCYPGLNTVCDENNVLICL